MLDQDVKEIPSTYPSTLPEIVDSNEVSDISGETVIEQTLRISLR